MAEFVAHSWLSSHLDDHHLRLLDPRPTVKYLLGHVKGAVSLPASKLFDSDTAALLPAGRLAEVFGDAGITSGSPVVVYDEYDGQRAAMLAWTLEYLGHPEVRILDTFFEQWKNSGKEVFYRPVQPRPTTFRSRPDLSVRAVCEELVGNRSVKLVDVRTPDEYLGRVAGEVRTGHLPGAVNLPWTKLLGAKNRFLPSRSDIAATISRVGLGPDDSIVTYCRTGPRAAVAYYALREGGLKNVRLYDGSFHEWAQRPRLQVEREPVA